MRPRARLASVLALGVVACGRAASPGAAITAGDIVIQHGFAFEPITAASGAAYFEVHNRAALADTILEVSSPVARAAAFHGVNMGHLDVLEVPAGTTVALKPGATHLMLTDFSAPPAAGDSLRLTLRFAHAGTLTFAVPVRRYGQ